MKKIWKFQSNMVEISVILWILSFFLSVFFIIFAINLVFHFGQQRNCDNRRFGENWCIINKRWSFNISFLAQPVVQATTTVYTIPANDPRYSATTTNVSTSLRHVYGKIFNYDNPLDII